MHFLEMIQTSLGVLLPADRIPRATSRSSYHWVLHSGGNRKKLQHNVFPRFHFMECHSQLVSGSIHFLIHCMNFPCQLSRLREEPHSNSSLRTLTGQFLTRGWKYLSCYSLADTISKLQVHEKWANDDTFLKISDFWRQDTGNVWSVIISLRSSDLYGASSKVFGLRKCSDIFENIRIWSCRRWKSWHSHTPR